jgi:hypothetical protein
VDHTAYHVGRQFVGHDIEDECPCPQASCGLVPMATVDPLCPHHPAERTKMVNALDAVPAAEE